MPREDRRRSTKVHEDNKAAVAAFFHRCLTQGDEDAVTALVTADVIDHARGLSGVDALKEAVGEARKGWLSLTYAIEDIIAEGDRVAVRWRAQGTRLNGREATWSGTGFYRLHDGRIAEQWTTQDELWLSRQLGESR